jgi:hypothetical protein
MVPDAVRQYLISVLPLEVAAEAGLPTGYAPARSRMSLSFNHQPYGERCTYLWNGLFSEDSNAVGMALVDIDVRDNAARAQALHTFQREVGGKSPCARALMVDHWWYTLATAMWYEMQKITMPLPVHHHELQHWVNVTDLHLPIPSWRALPGNLFIMYENIHVEPKRGRVGGHAPDATTHVGSSKSHEVFDLQLMLELTSTPVRSCLHCTVTTPVGMVLYIPDQRSHPVRSDPWVTVDEVRSLILTTSLLSKHAFDAELSRTWANDHALQEFPCIPLLCEGAFEVELPHGLTSFLKFERLLNRMMTHTVGRSPLLEFINFRSHVMREGRHFMQYQFMQPRYIDDHDRDFADALRV